MKIRVFILIMWCGWGMVQAKPRQIDIRPTMTVEEEQRFLYYFYEAQRLMEAEEYEKSWQLMLFCYQLNPMDAAVNASLGDFCAGMNRWESATDFYEQAMKSDSKMEQLAERLRDCYAHQKRFADALAMQDKIDKEEGYDIYGAIERYRLYAMAGDAQGALKAINDYLRMDPTNVQFLLFRVELLEAIPSTRLKDKTSAYEEALVACPNHPSLLNNYAYLLATHKGDLQRAEQMSQQAIDADPYNPVYLDTYAWILYLRGQKTLALFYIQSAINFIKGELPHEIQEHYQTIRNAQ